MSRESPPPEAVADQWAELVADADAMAERYRSEGWDVLVVVAEAPAVERAVLVPAYLSPEDVEPLRERADAEGAMYTHVRTLATDARVTVRHEDPRLLLRAGVKNGPNRDCVVSSVSYRSSIGTKSRSSGPV